MSGLFSAAFLRRIGWDVEVYERSALELVGRGAAARERVEQFRMGGDAGAAADQLKG